MSDINRGIAAQREQDYRLERSTSQQTPVRRERSAAQAEEEFRLGQRPHRSETPQDAQSNSQEVVERQCSEMWEKYCPSSQSDSISI